MSYIEKKYLDNIKEIFDQLTDLDNKVLELINHKSIKHGDEIAKICADINKKINTILGKYYPEITFRVQIPNLFPNWFTPSSEYTEYSRIGGIGGISIFPPIWGGIGDSTGWGTGIWYPGLTGGGSSWSSGGWPWGGIGAGSLWPVGAELWQTGGSTNPPTVIY